MDSNVPPAVVPPPIHLDTIYEESASSLTSSSSPSAADARQPFSSRPLPPSTFPFSSNHSAVHGLISARSIPSVDAFRLQQTNDSHERPPIEVRFRDGSTRYIHPATNPRLTNSLRKNASIIPYDAPTSLKMTNKHRPTFNSMPKKKMLLLAKKPTTVLTIITAQDLMQAGITPPMTTSPEESESLTITRSRSNSSVDTMKSAKDADEVTMDRLSITAAPLAQPVMNASMAYPRYPVASRHRSQQPPLFRHPQQMPSIRSHSVPSLQTPFNLSRQKKPLSNHLPPSTAAVASSHQKPAPSIQIMLTNDENERNRSLTSTFSLPPGSSNEPKNSLSNIPLRPPPAHVLVGGGSRSAFRPFLKQPAVNPVSSRVSSTALPRSSQQPIRSVFHAPHSQQRTISLLSNARQPTTTIHRRINPHATHHEQTHRQITTTIYAGTSTHQQDSVLPKTTTHHADPSPAASDDTDSSIPSVSISIEPHLQWHSVTSKSLHDVPRLLSKYSDMPLRITLPVGTPTHNQKLLVKHDHALERRLANAGLSPETIALYERILEVADVRPISIVSPPKIIDHYQPDSSV